MIIKEEDHLAHYGTPRKSGRYPWGSGGDESTSQRNKTFLDAVAGMRAKGLSQTEIASGLGITTTELRARTTIARNEQKQSQISQAARLKETGMSNSAIGREMGLNESSVRSLLVPSQKLKADILGSVTGMIKSAVEKKELVDIGAGVENHLGISKDKLRAAVAVLQESGYKVHYVKVAQLGTGKFTTVKVLSKDDMTYSDVLKKKDKIDQITDYSLDGGESFHEIHPPLSINPGRVSVRYAEQGGAQSDGVIFVRPGVKDIEIGANHYAQVRVQVGDGHFLKGMAMYKDDLPDGVDLVFNTNKSSTGNKLDAMKKLEDDAELPFGSIVRQIPGKDGKPSSVMNIVNEQGDWDKWARSLSSQFLSKQNPTLAKTQLDMTYEQKQNELDAILKLNNPAVKRKLLEGFADDADSSAVHLKAAALPRQANHVILPVENMKENEIYAPNYQNGERVALVRFPHGGTFEIPELTVNNKSITAKKLLGTHPEDAVGIHPKVAARLSGADFDGDTVLVIPNNSGRVKSTSALEGLQGFEPKVYKLGDDAPRMSSATKQREMGNISNLITDMTIKGANTTELARAVRHSMVVIDAEKHHLDYKQSAKDNGIAALKVKYQGSARGGANTVISNSGKNATTRVAERKQGFRIDPATGKKVFTETGNKFVNKDGKTVIKTDAVAKLATVDDAHVFSSGTKVESIYADHSNRLKALADKARLEIVHTKSTPQSSSAKTAYSAEVASLNSKLNIALRNAPLERQAQIVANAQVSLRRQSNPNMEAGTVKKIQSQELTKARNRVGAGKERVEITDSEWAAIQAGAISNHKLTQILNNADVDRVKELATPRTATVMTAAKTARAKTMLASGYTQAQVAAQLGVALSTLKSSAAVGDE